MKIVGLTGGIGSGKTTVSNRFEYLGVPVIDADVISHELTRVGELGYNEIVHYFGEGILNDDKEIDRSLLRTIVFENPKQKQALESILHPKIRAKMRNQADRLDTVYCIFSIPLLIESGQHTTVDRVLVVDAPDDKRIEWIKSRSGLSEAEITSIFAAQLSREKRLSVADDILNNNGTLEDLTAQVDSTHHRYLELWSN